MRMPIRHPLVGFSQKGSEKMIKQIWIASESNMDLYDLIGIVIDNLGITIEQIVNLDYAREDSRKEIREVNKQKIQNKVAKTYQKCLSPLTSGLVFEVKGIMRKLQKNIVKKGNDQCEKPSSKKVQ